MAQDDGPGKTSWPIIQIRLIEESALVEPVITPFEAPVSPPMKAGERRFIASKGEKAGVVDPGLPKIHQLGGKPMADNGNRVISDFIKEWTQVTEEKQVCIEIVDAVDFRMFAEDEQKQGRLAGNIVFK